MANTLFDALKLKGINVATGFTAQAPSPLDVRLVVDTIEDRDKLISEDGAYEGMPVYVKEDKVTYVLKTLTPKDASNSVWEPLGEGSGVGEATESGGERFNDYTNNDAMHYAHAEGFDNVAGSKAFTIANIHENLSGDSHTNTGYYILDIATEDDVSKFEELATYIQEQTAAKDAGTLSLKDYNSNVIFSVHIAFTDGNGNAGSEQDENVGQITNVYHDVSSNEYRVEVSQLVLDTNILNRVFRVPDTFVNADGVDGELNTFRLPYASHLGTRNIGHVSHAEGWSSRALGKGSHAEGASNISAGSWSHTEGSGNYAIYAAHAEGKSNKALGQTSHAEGQYTTASGSQSHSEGGSTTASGRQSHAEGSSTTASGSQAHAEGYNTKASNEATHSEGSNTVASGPQSHAEGLQTVASSTAAHAEGYKSQATGQYNHAEGSETYAANNATHAEGWLTKATGNSCHAEGYKSHAAANQSHAEGFGTVAAGVAAHSEGYYTKANARYSHTEGNSTIASGENQHVQGKFNLEDKSNTYAHIVGGGNSDTSRKNIHTLDWSGNAWFSGKLDSSFFKVTDVNASLDSLLCNGIYIRPTATTSGRDDIFAIDLLKITNSVAIGESISTYKDAIKDEKGNPIISVTQTIIPTDTPGIQTRKATFDVSKKRYVWTDWESSNTENGSVSNAELLERIEKLEAICNVTYKTE